MHYYEVALNRIVRADADTFTYASEEALQLGQLVRVPVGSKAANGIVMQIVDKPGYEVRPIERVLEEVPLPAAQISLARWLSQY